MMSWRKTLVFGAAMSVIITLLSDLGIAVAGGMLPIRLTSDRPKEKFVRYEGDIVRLTIAAEEECFVTVMAVDIEGEIRVLWPHHSSYCNHLWPGERRTVEFGEELKAAHPGPVFIMAYADVNVRSRFHFNDEQVPFLARSPFARRANEPLFLSQWERDFPLAMGHNPPRDIRSINSSEARRLAEELESIIYADYDKFVPVMDNFLGWMAQVTERMPPSDYGTDALDLYVAPYHYSPQSYRIVAGQYQPPTHRDFRRVHFDPFTTYGRWITIGSMQVWQPEVSQGWRPFMNGRWAWTRYGWTWMSYEPWGDVTDHYGYWCWHPRYHWVWVPDDTWKPAPIYWVALPDHIIWYPELPPNEIIRALGREFSFAQDAPGMNMIPSRDFTREDLADFLISHIKAADMMAKSRDTARKLANGPERDIMARAGGSRPATLELMDGSAVNIGKLNRQFIPKVARETGEADSKIKNLILRREKELGRSSDESAEPRAKSSSESANAPKKELRGKRYSGPSFDPSAYEAEQEKAEE